MTKRGVLEHEPGSGMGWELGSVAKPAIFIVEILMENLNRFVQQPHRRDRVLVVHRPADHLLKGTGKLICCGVDLSAFLVPRLGEAVNDIQKSWISAGVQV